MNDVYLSEKGFFRLCLPFVLLITSGLFLARLFQPGAATFGASDRPRWSTVRSLVESGTYVIGKRLPSETSHKPNDVGIIREDGWGTIDKVLSPATKEFYSSKPPFLSTIVAGVYWLIHFLSGLRLSENPWIVTRVILIVVNFFPLILYVYLMYKLSALYAKQSWTVFFVLISSCFGTFITTFSVTLNNHTIASVGVAVCLYSCCKILSDPGPFRHWFVGAFFSGFCVCCELPCLALYSLLILCLCAINIRRTICVVLPISAIPLIFFVITNVAAIGDLFPAYSKLYSPWYEFEGGYWKEGMGTRGGIDTAGMHENKAEYVFNMLLGHHGLFSLSPIFLLSFWPLYLKLDGPDRNTGFPPHKHLKTISWGSFFLFLVVFAFYGFSTSNYGGLTCGPRWFFWLTPLFLISLVPALDVLSSSSLGRKVCYVFLFISIFSSNYRLINPWSHPWIFDLFRLFNWVPY